MSVLEYARKSTFLRRLYRLPGVARLYHFKMALLGAALNGFPSRRLTVIGVTGTKGKTTTVELTAAMLEAAGLRTAVLNSVRSRIASQARPNRTSNSMPGRMFIQRFLKDALRAGCTHAVLEVTSEGVAQGRHRFIRWSAAAITNIAPEHIESHGSFENYRDAKLSFLKYAACQGAPVFVNRDDEPSGYFMANLPREAAVLYSTDDIASWPDELFKNMPGGFNRANAAAASALAGSLGVPEEARKEALRSFQGVPGRMEFVAQSPFRVVVDYAHTPDSLEAVYKTLRADMPKGARLIGVFGSCGGHRDKWKRPVMGKAAARYADMIVLTDEDPYDEDPSKILGDIHKGISASVFPEDRVLEILDRKEAIRRALSEAHPGDTVVMTGKGSEAFIHISGGRTVDWSERAAAEEALATLNKKDVIRNRK